MVDFFSSRTFPSCVQKLLQFRSSEEITREGWSTHFNSLKEQLTIRQLPSDRSCSNSPTEDHNIENSSPPRKLLLTVGFFIKFCDFTRAFLPMTKLEMVKNCITSLLAFEIMFLSNLRPSLLQTLATETKLNELERLQFCGTALFLPWFSISGKLFLSLTLSIAEIMR